ncbi:MAG: hypothetical protein WCK57_06665 [Verrucomicrobiae bacterium]
MIPITVIFIWKKKTGSILVFKFKRPFWLAILIFIEMIAVGFLGTKLTPKVFNLFDIHYEKLGFQDLISVAFALLALVGEVCLIGCCFWYLIAAILSYVRAKQISKK